MRKILFRGKRIDNGEWVYGFYANIPEHHIDKLSGKDCIVSINNGLLMEVIPETVGEYTGLKDKNGKKIFEGDIVKLTDKSFDYKWKAVVEFGNPNGNYSWGWQLSPLGKVDINTDILCWVEMEETGAFCEIIGNIHDNPELLQEDMK